MKLSAKMKVSASKSATSPSCKTLAVSLKDDTNNEMDDNNNITIWTDRL
jgi:hypothetical protein